LHCCEQYDALIKWHNPVGRRGYSYYEIIQDRVVAQFERVFCCVFGRCRYSTLIQMACSNFGETAAEISNQ